LYGKCPDKLQQYQVELILLPSMLVAAAASTDVVTPTTDVATVVYLLGENDVSVGTVPVIAIVIVVVICVVVDIMVIIIITLCMVDLDMVGHELLHCQIFILLRHLSFGQWVCMHLQLSSVHGS